MHLRSLEALVKKHVRREAVVLQGVTNIRLEKTRVRHIAETECVSLKSDSRHVAESASRVDLRDRFNRYAVVTLRRDQRVIRCEPRKPVEPVIQSVVGICLLCHAVDSV